MHERLSRLRDALTRKIRVHKAIVILGYLAMSVPTGYVLHHGLNAGKTALIKYDQQNAEEDIERARAYLRAYEVDGDKKKLERAKIIVLRIEKEILYPEKPNIREAKLLKLPNLNLVKIKLQDLKELIAELEKTE